MKSRISKYMILQKERVLHTSYRPTWDQGIFSALVILALILRLWELNGRPFHYDESLHAIYSWELFTGMGYRHEAWTHGPMQFFLNALSFSIFSDTELLNFILRTNKLLLLIKSVISEAISIT